MANNTTYLKSQAITTTVAGSSPDKTYTPSVGAVSTDSTLTYGDSIGYGSPEYNIILVITDDLVTTYAD